MKYDLVKTFEPLLPNTLPEPLILISIIVKMILPGLSYELLFIGRDNRIVQYSHYGLDVHDVLQLIVGLSKKSPILMNINRFGSSHLM